MAYLVSVFGLRARTPSSGTRYLYVEMCGVNGTFPDHASAQYGQYMLMALALLHCFWFYLLNRIAYKLVMGNDANKVGDEEYEITMKV